MGYRNMGQCLRELEARGELVRISGEMDPFLEIGAVQRRVFQAGGPALLFENVRGTRFPMAANVFGTLERVRWLFRDTLPTLRRLFALKVDPLGGLKKPWKYAKVPLALVHALPRSVPGGPVMTHQTSVSELPHLTSWPMDGGAYVTLPQVYSESPATAAPIWACTACSSRATTTRRTRKWACTTRSTAAWACTTPRPSRAASPCP